MIFSKNVLVKGNDQDIFGLSIMERCICIFKARDLNLFVGREEKNLMERVGLIKIQKKIIPL